MNTLSLHDVVSRVQLQGVEAVAVAQQLLHAAPRPVDVARSKPASVDTVFISSDGSVFCASAAAPPDIADIGALLQAMLPASGAARVSGSIRYTIARAIAAAPAPPFPSRSAFAAALARHQPGDPSTLVRSLYARITAEAPQSAARAGERRRVGRAAVELRRHLRRADEERFLLAHPAPMRSTTPAPPPARSSATARRMAGAGAAILIAFGSGYITIDRLSRAPRSSVKRREVALTAGALSVVRIAPLWTGALRAPSVSVASIESAPDDAVVRAVPPPIGQAFPPSFASNGTAMFFRADRTASTRSALEEADLGGDLRVMTIRDDGAKNFHVRPSPDGWRVAFDSDRNGERGVYIANVDGSDAHRVSGDGFAALPSWSTDGGTLAFVRGEPDRPQVWNLWLLDLASGRTSRVTSFRDGQTWSASWFPDGRRICYSHADQLFIQDVNTGETRQFASPIPRRLVRTPAVAPDGGHVIFQVSGSGAWLLDVPSGAMRFILTDPTADEFAWAPDGRRVAFHSARSGGWGIWVMSSADNQ